MSQVRGTYPEFTDEQVNELKENEYAKWLKFYVDWLRQQGHVIPTWLEDIMNKPSYIAISYPTYYTRGYGFKLREGTSRRCADDGICTQSGDSVYYGTIKEILQISWPGILGLKCVAFYCKWYNPVFGTGVVQDEFGVTSVNKRMTLQKYDPFIIASQADQVCYLPYPRLTATQRNADEWITATRINPRSMVEGVTEQAPLQENTVGVLGDISNALDVDLVMYSNTLEDEDHDLFDDSEEELDEFEHEDNNSSENSQQSD